MINEENINFNIVCKKLGADKMSFYLGVAADEMREVMMSELVNDKAKAKL